MVLGSASDVMNNAKREIFRLDLERTLQRHSVPMNWPSAHPQSTVMGLRMLCALSGSDRVRLMHALFKAYWVDNRPMSDEEIESIATRTLTRPWTRPGENEKADLFSNVERLVQMGGFGVPTFGEFGVGSLFLLSLTTYASGQWRAVLGSRQILDGDECAAQVVVGTSLPSTATGTNLGWESGANTVVLL